MILRDYQHNILEEVKSGFTQNDLKVVTLGMGGGKSLIISQVAKYYFEQGKNIVILTNITELIFQLKEYLEDLNLDYKVIKSSLGGIGIEFEVMRNSMINSVRFNKGVLNIEMKGSVKSNDSLSIFKDNKIFNILVPSYTKNHKIKESI